MKRAFRKYIWSLDFLTATVLTSLAFVFLPSWVDGELSKELLSIGINVLAVIFSIFFAALAFIISSSDNEFVSFLEEEGMFSELVSSFKLTLYLLFCALIFALVLYVVVCFGYSKSKGFCIHKSLMLIYCFLFFYSLVASILATTDAITFAKKRAEFITFMRNPTDPNQ